jgi:hypothetical protein
MPAERKRGGTISKIFFKGDTAVVVATDRSRSLRERRKTKGIQTKCCPTKEKKRKNHRHPRLPRKTGERKGKKNKKNKFRAV